MFQADASLEMEHRDFIRAGLEYVCLIQEVQERKKFEFVETVSHFYHFYEVEVLNSCLTQKKKRDLPSNKKIWLSFFADLTYHKIELTVVQQWRYLYVG